MNSRNSKKLSSKKGEIKYGSSLELKNTNIIINIQSNKKKNKNKKKGIHKNEKTDLYSENNDVNKSKKKNKKIESIYEKKHHTFKDFELNLICFKLALQYDKRTFCQYYSSLFFYNNIILFSFYPISDYNLKIIKIAIFFLSFDIYFLINTLFFNNSTIHQIYKDGGAYNLSYFMPKIIISFFISYYIITIIKYFSISQPNLLEIKNEEDYINAQNKGNKIKKFLVTKYILFFLLSFIFLGFFWYYLSSFCAVFKNSQILVIKNAVLSLVISLIYPLIFNIITCIIRLTSLKDNTSFNSCTYKASQIMQFL